MLISVPIHGEIFIGSCLIGKPSVLMAAANSLLLTPTGLGILSLIKYSMSYDEFKMFEVLYESLLFSLNRYLRDSSSLWRSNGTSSVIVRREQVGDERKAPEQTQCFIVNGLQCF